MQDTRPLAGKTPGANTGIQAEAQAARWLEQQGLTIIDCNLRCKGGELDLIALDQSTLVFVEVRLRATTKFGGAVASVDHFKQLKLRRAANWYLNYIWKTSIPACRFDVVAIQPGMPIQWIRNAF